MITKNGLYFRKVCIKEWKLLDYKTQSAYPIQHVSVRTLQGNRTNRMHVHRERKLYFKELAHTLVGTGKYRTCMAGQQAGDPGKRLMLQLKSKTIWRKDSSLSQETSVFYLKSFNRLDEAYPCHGRYTALLKVY